MDHVPHTVEYDLEQRRVIVNGNTLPTYVGLFDHAELVANLAGYKLTGQWVATGEGHWKAPARWMPRDEVNALAIDLHAEMGLPTFSQTHTLWSIQQVAAHFGVSESHARDILSQAGVRSGYDPVAVRAIRRPGRGRRTDLASKVTDPDS
jgi:hypothetical protein